MGNNPVSGVDPDGRWSDDPIYFGADIKDVVCTRFVNSSRSPVNYPAKDAMNLAQQASLQAQRNAARRRIPQGGGGNSWLNKAWNSNFVRAYIPDAVYVNGSFVGTFVGGGGADIGLAIPLRGITAGNVYLFSTLKGKMGLHGGLSLNVGKCHYTGSPYLFDFENSFGGGISWF